MLVNIKLQNNIGFKWYNYKNIHIKGFLFNEHNNFLSGKRLLDYFCNIKTKKELHAKLKVVNGCFTAIIFIENSFFAIVDITRTFPLFYYQENDYHILISDNANIMIKRIKNAKIQEISKIELLFTGYVTGKNTLIENFFQIQAGSYIEIVNDKIKENFYFNYYTNYFFNESYNELKEKLRKIIYKTFERLIASLNNRIVVVPLSSGFDSRLIVTMLNEFGYKNVICFSYGNRNSFEVKASRKIAKKIGYKWYFVEYSKKIIKGFIDDVNFNHFYKYATNLTSIFHIQDYFAIKNIFEKKIVPNDAIIIPGHTGDFISGGHIPDELFNSSEVTKQILLSGIIEKHYNLKLNDELIDYLIPKINKELLYSKNHVNSHLYYENWEMKERQAKFIVNANRVYEFWGYEHRIPLWDLELVDFFLHLPIKYKKQSLLYRDVLSNIIFKKYDLQKDVNSKRPHPIFKPGKFKTLLLNITPKMIYQIYCKRGDYNNFRYMIQEFQKNMKQNTYNSVSINQAISQWYLYKLERS